MYVVCKLVQYAAYFFNIVSLNYEEMNYISHRLRSDPYISCMYIYVLLIFLN